jgi:hypothetical protein
MNCVASTYNASGKLVGCTEQDLTSIISIQMYTMFAVGTGLYLYKTLTAENWVDIAILIGWGCVSTFTRTKRVVTRYVFPGLQFIFQSLSDVCAKCTTSTADDVDRTEDLIRVVKDGVETTYSSVFEFVHDLDERFTEPSCPRRSRAVSDVVDEDVVSVHLCDTESSETEKDASKEEQDKKQEALTEDADNNAEDETKDHGDASANNTDEEEEDEEEEEEEEEDEEEEEENISELLARIENHTMHFDFLLSRVPTAVHLVGEGDSKNEGGYVMKYDGFPRDSLGVHFYDRKFVPVDHRMMEIVLQHDNKEYDLNLASPDNFYVAGNKLLDPAFVKWFMLKNHGVKINTSHGSDGDKYNYVIKCVDHTATLHTLHPHNYLYISVSGFEVQDSGLV